MNIIQSLSLALLLVAVFYPPAVYAHDATILHDDDHGRGRITEPLIQAGKLLLLEPFDPDKIPVLMIHGLRSNPKAWNKLTRELRKDPSIHVRFQIWHYRYPTGGSYLCSAGALREELEKIRREYDPAGASTAFESLVIVAHSLGGLLSKPLISDSGTLIWDAVIAVPPPRLEASPRDLETLRRCFVFEPLPYIDRVIFLATPHRGSQLAESLVGRLGAALARRSPNPRASFRRVISTNRELIRPPMRKLLRRGGATSIKALSPRYPLLRILAEIPFASGVAVHTIIGDRGLLRGRKARHTDGVVTHRSARLAYAASELVLPAGHGVWSHPRAIAEVRRILYEHATSP